MTTVITDGELYDELSEVFTRCLDRFETIAYTNDRLPIFREEMVSLQKKWGTWEPDKQMEMISFVDGKEVIRVCENNWYDPNFFMQVHYVGGGIDGFTTSFKSPSSDNTTVRFYSSDKKFVISIE